MPQVQLPMFPAGANAINTEMGFEAKDGRVVYLSGHLPVFTHRQEDLGAFRYYTSQLIINGTATQEQIVQAFNVPLTTVKRYCRIYREQGLDGFVAKGKKRSGHRLTPERLVEVQSLLDQGKSVPEIAELTGLLRTTLHKAIDQGRLKQIKKK
jgi:transposase